MSMETFETLWQYCTENHRVIPRDWNKFYNLLNNKKQKSSGGWEPSLPLILAAWDMTLPIEKQLRFKEHVQWAISNQQNEEASQYLRALSEDKWYHFGEL